ncbi:aldehyde dehydrogenase [Cocleimonas sp. KMM 6892]|uniref:acetaldehyde dehydrogenase ExaC n=1 Tax=unclassified Cocleimonas TaxID=2639732 RepID=UPI002DB95251|nr:MULTISPECIES: aldehyde dehydrogenase family protein [unclassified Cocleimonas]MEB8434016.1 aldehyde dehydrogenase [Cocleimonas sp. KMM 6892]MEC4716827.1 aldehyde dehydrogenase [Cocleimonas sp. KMM 6895]MEC4746018.1 aldehyde dehydrogenase [Cocleimonas sp. KMM 6896]
MIYPDPNTPESEIQFKSRYENYIGGEWVPPQKGQYFENVSPVNGKVYCEVARSSAEDIELALDAAHSAKDAWGKTSVTERSNILLKIADRIEENLELLAIAETYDNGKGIRETMAADVPLAADHFRYFAGCIRAQEGGISELDETTVAYHYHEPLGVVGQIIPWNFPLLMAAWKIPPALAAGNCIVLKPAEQTPLSISLLMEIIGDLLPSGVLNVVQGFGQEAGQALATSERISKIAFTGSTAVGQHILKCAADSLIPSTVELGGKSPNIFFDDIMNHEDAYLEKCLEGAALAFFNQGEVCTCPSRILVQENIADDFIERLIAKSKTIKQGNPLDTDSQVGAQVSKEQFDIILNYIEIGKAEGAEVLTGGCVALTDDSLNKGFYIEPTVLKGTNDMRVFQEEIFGPVISVTTFKDEAEAIALANDSEYGLGAGLWTRDMNKSYRMGRAIQAGRVWTNCYHLYPAHAAFGGYKKSGIGRENHGMMLNHYQQTKNLLVSYSEDPLGFF